MFLGISLARYTLFPFVIKRLIRHSAQSMFLGTIPMGLATIINATVLIAVPQYGEWAKVVAQALWWIDVVLSVMTSFGVPFLMFQLHNLSLDKMTGAWLLPVVPTTVAAASGGLLATVLPPGPAVNVAVVSYVLWGIGMGTSFMIMALYFHRLTIHHLPDAEVVVSAFLPLGPLGQGAFGMIQLSQTLVSWVKVLPVRLSLTFLQHSGLCFGGLAFGGLCMVSTLCWQDLCMGK